MSTLRQFFSHRLIWLALLVSLGIGALFARSIWTIRTDAWDYAVQTNTNLAQAVERSLVWALDAYDKSLQGVANEVSRPEVWALPPDMRARLVFDNALRIQGAGDVLVLDAKGDVILDSTSLVPRKGNFADRDYFQAFQAGAHEGLFVGKPIPSRVTGVYVLPLSRAYHHADGSFAGVVAGALRLSFLNELFGSIDLGASSGVNLFRADGIVISRFPYGDADVGKTIADSSSFLRFNAEGNGTFVGTAALDGVQRLYAFRKVGDYPLILNVAQAADTILSRWYRSALALGAFALLLMLACLGLAALFVRELNLRQQVSGQLQQAEHDLRTILNNVPSMIGYWDRDLHNRFANHAYVDWFGQAPGTMRGKHIRELLGETLYEANWPFLEQALQGHEQLFERTMVNPQGEARHAIASYVPDFDGDTVRGIFVQVTDITERKRMEEALFDEKERMRLTLKSIGDAVVCTDAQGRVTYLNPVAQRLTGWQAFDAAGRNVDEVLSLQQPDNEALLANPLRQAMEQAAMADTVRGIVVHRSTGQRFQVEATASPIADRHGAVTGAVAVLRDVTDAVVMAERMAHLAQYDALTDLPNRVLLQDRAQQAIAQVRRDGRSLAVMYLDLDGFKAVNDRLGHDAGDQLLVQFAQRLKATVRASDTVCRQGGDEFVVLLPGLDGPEPACGVARKILQACHAPFDLGREVVRIGLSGGIALYPEHGDTFDSLSRHADTAMYKAKRGGRMRFMLYRGPDSEPEVVLAHTSVYPAA